MRTLSFWWSCTIAHYGLSHAKGDEKAKALGAVQKAARGGGRRVPLLVWTENARSLLPNHERLLPDAARTRLAAAITL